MMSEQASFIDFEHRSQFERLVLGISTQFINLGLQAIDPAIEHALGRIGEFCSVDRAYVFLISASCMSNTHEWCAPGVTPQIANLQDLPCAAFPWWTERILRQEVIHIPLVSALPEAAATERAILEEQDIVSVVVVPLVFENRALGFIGFDSIRHGKRWTEDDIVLLRIAGEIVVSALERKRADVQRRALEEQLVQAKSLDNVARLAGGVAHDFNNLLSVILNHAQVLQRDISDARLKEYVRVLYESATQAADLTRQLMIVGRRDLVHSESLDVNVVLESLAKLLERTLGEAVEFSLLLHPGCCYVRIGKAHIKQVVVNLVLNARDALPTGGRVSIETSLMDQTPLAWSPAAGSGRWVRLRVHDSGRGMSAEVKGRAFEPFFSTKGTLGTGLGLSTVQSIVQQAGGQIVLESAPGRGTAVEVYFPEVSPPPHVQESAPARPELAPGRGELILIVEDAAPLRALVEHTLRAHGYATISAAHPERALELAAAAGPIHLLLSDVILPMMSGFELATQLAPLRPEMRVAYMSGYDGEILAGRTGADEGVALLPKPFLEEDLLRFVRGVLDRPSV